MKTSLLKLPILFALLVTVIHNRSYSQACNVTNITVRLNSANPSGGNCQINLDLSWDQSNNNGNKWTNLHIWTAAAYPVPPIDYSSAPDATDLGTALGTIVVKDPDQATPTINPVYQNAPTATILSSTGVSKVYVSGTGNNAVYRFTITGVTMTIPGSCGTAINLKADIWSSNASSNNGVQCTSLGNPFVANDPTVNGMILCNTPREFVVNIKSVLNTTQNAIYTVWFILPLPLLSRRHRHSITVHHNKTHCIRTETFG